MATLIVDMPEESEILTEENRVDGEGCEDEKLRGSTVTSPLPQDVITKKRRTSASHFLEANPKNIASVATTDISTSHIVTVASTNEDSPSLEPGSDPPLNLRDSLPESSRAVPQDNFPTTISFSKGKEEMRKASSSASTKTNMKLPTLKRKFSSLEETYAPIKAQANVVTASPSASPVSTKRLCSSVPIAPKPRSTLLLARPKDDIVLSPLHAFVRKQIEVFSATARDIAQPAPGRKNPVALHQIGLRCIHCRDVPLKQRVKRAVCYPSTVGRVYHSVSDMKHDHFKACPHMPPEVRQEFMQLKEEKGKSKGEKKISSKVTGCSSSTAQYYHDAALQMGMRDGSGGVFWNENGKESLDIELGTPPVAQADSMIQSKAASEDKPSPPALPKTPRQDLIAQLTACQQFSLPSHLASALAGQQEMLQRAIQHQVFLGLLARRNSEGMSSLLLPKPQAPAESTEKTIEVSQHIAIAADKQTGGWPVSCPMDKDYLNPIHCFVRRHVEFFVAGEEDVKAPSPGRKVRAILGQVGIRCIHCSRLPPKNRVKRSICYPPSIGGIYHAVSNIKCDHFALCKGLPTVEKEEFLRLRSSGTRKSSSGSKPAKADRGLANSTAQYYHDSALRMGLIDTPDGIRFAARPKKLEEPPQSKPESAVDGTKSGMEALMAATDLVTGTEEKPTAATGVESV